MDVIKKILLLIAVSVLSISARAQSDSIRADTTSRQSVGLVLSGGGAKGIAHVGVIKALEDNDIPIDYVTGTSMGAIVGSLYACGWSPDRMMRFFTQPDFVNWSTGVINKKYIWCFYEHQPTPKWASFNLDFNFRKSRSLQNQIIPTSLVSPLPMNIEFLNLYGPYGQQCGDNFNRLFVPFRCVASDVYHKHKVVFDKGSLADAVRASMSFPVVFRPIEVNGVLLYDGGIYDNFPVNVMEKDFNPDFIVGVSVSGADSKPIRGDMYSQLEDMIIQNNDYSLPADRGIKIQVPVLNYGVLQFDKANTIYEIGYKTGMSMVDSIKSRLAARVPLAKVTARRDSFARATPQLMFDSVEIKGVEGSQAHYLRYLFTGDRPQPFGMDRTVNAYYRAVTDGSLSNLVPQRVQEPNGNNILLLKATPRRPWTIGVGGYVTTSTNSMLYFSGSYHTLGLNSLDVSFSAWVGQAYMAAMGNVKFYLRTDIPSYVELTGVLSKQKFYEDEVLFFKTKNPKFTTETENYLRAGYVWALGRRAKGYASLAGGWVENSYYTTDTNESGGLRDKVRYWLGLLRFGVEGNSLDNQMYPSSGYKWFVNVDASYQASKFDPYGAPEDFDRGWRDRPVMSLSAMWERFFPVGKWWSVGAYGAGAATLQHLDLNFLNSKIHAHAFAPTPATKNYFNMAFRSDNYLAVGCIPMWKPIKLIQVRCDLYAFMPVRQLIDNGRFNNAYYQGWFQPIRFLGEMAVICNLPFASISFYGNYMSSPARNWNFGISFGLLFKAPGLLRG